MVLSPQLVSILVLVALGLGTFALFLLIASAPRRRRPPEEPVEPGDLLVAHDHAIGELRDAVRALAGEGRQHAEGIHASIRRMGLVRYDAFEDMAGHLSFSAALLDDGGNGIVITSINGRQDTRCYAKPVDAGHSEYNLSVEEEEAIRQALAPPSRGEAVEVPVERRARRIRA
jgi:hypothetical protein